MIKSYVDNALKNYPRIVSASVISIKDKQAVVRMPYATDDSSDFKAYVVTSQLISIGDVVNVAYWSSLSTAVILANTSTESASIGVAGDYNTLENKPTINGVSLVGDKTSSDLKLYGDGNEPNYPVTSVNDKTGAVALAKGDVGLGNVDNVKQYSASNPPPYPVTSVDGATGAVVTNAVKTTAQTLTEAQKQQARTNIGAGVSSFSGDYNDLTNKPNLSNIVPSGAIMMWSGSSAAIPDGFVLCNGNNGTPNLVDKFIVGGTTSGATGSIGSVPAGPQISYYTLCYIMKT